MRLFCAKSFWVGFRLAVLFHVWTVPAWVSIWRADFNKLGRTCLAMRGDWLWSSMFHRGRLDGGDGF